MYGASPYDSPYNDMDFGAGPSRPAPMPYDDPYSDTYGLPEPSSSTSGSTNEALSPQPEQGPSRLPESPPK